MMPKICYSKIFWAIISSSFAFTFFVYGVVNHQIDQVNAEVDKRTEIIYKVPVMVEKIEKIDDKTDQLLEDVSFIKGKLEKIG